MILEIGNQNLIGSKKKAFTIVEVMLVLALIGLVAGLFAVNFDVLLKAIGEKRPEKVLYEAICEARYQALQEHGLVYLSFNDKDHQFLIYKDPEKPIAKMPLKEGIRVSFEPIPPTPLGKSQPPQSSSQRFVEKIAFSPDGSSETVIVTLNEGNFTLKFKPDPLSCGIISA